MMNLYRCCCFLAGNDKHMRLLKDHHRSWDIRNYSPLGTRNWRESRKEKKKKENQKLVYLGLFGQQIWWMDRQKPRKTTLNLRIFHEIVDFSCEWSVNSPTTWRILLAFFLGFSCWGISFHWSLQLKRKIERKAKN